MTIHSPTSTPISVSNRDDRRRLLTVGILSGALATLAMLLVMGALRIAAGIPTPPESIPDRFAPTLTISLFFKLFSIFHGYNGLKRFGIVSVLAGIIVVGIVVGIVYTRMIARRRAGGTARAALFLGGVVALLWVGTMIVLIPVLATNFLGRSPSPATAFTIVGLLVAYLAYGIVLALACRLLIGDAARVPSPAPAPQVGRREVIALGVGALGVVGVGAMLKSLNSRAVFNYDGMQYKGAGVQPITPTDRFYSVTKNVVDPAPDAGVWRLEVGGKVHNGRTYAFDDLRALAPIEQETTLMCISNQPEGGLMSNARWKGVPLNTILTAAAPDGAIAEIKLYGADGYTDTIPFAKAMEPTTLLVYEMNGAPLTAKHGYPVRVVVPGMFGEKNVKWVTRIELVDHDVKGFYEQQGWGPNFVIPTHSRFDAPDFGQPLHMGVVTTLKGVAFCGDRGVSRVEVSADDGATWQEARRDYPGTRLTWALWSYDWTPPRPGDYHLAVRATDSMGAVQPAEHRDIAPQGATGYHRVIAKVI